MQLNLSVLQMHAEPAEHVHASFFRCFHGKRVAGIVSAGETMGHSREDLHDVVNLHPRNKIHECVRSLKRLKVWKS
jgi:hypothetical protein